MKKLLLTCLFLAPTVSWAAYQPISGSTITVSPYNNTTLPVSGTVSATGVPASLTATVTSGTGTWSTSGSALLNNATVTPGTGTWSVGGIPASLTTTVTPGTGTWATSGSALLNNATVTPGTGTWPVSGTFWQTTQPVSAVPVSMTATVTPGTGTFSVQGSLSDNGAASTTNRNASLPAIYQSSATLSSGFHGNNAALRVGTKEGSLRVSQDVDITRYAFSASTNNFTLASSPTDITGLCGNAQTTTLVTGLRVSCTQTTAGIVQGSVIKYSSKFAGAWSTATAVSQDSNFGLATSTVTWFTANPTRGVEVGHVDDVLFGVMAPATATPNDIYISPASWRNKPQVLRGAAQCITFNLEGVTATGGKCSVAWDWLEDANL